ncbi:MAG TPA: hypothetical protein VK446_12725 [Methylocystis sp.]|nr:hypothetical protein [Methylocystis sp.]
MLKLMGRLLLRAILCFPASCQAFAEDISQFNTLQTAAPATIGQIKILDPKFSFHKFGIQSYGGLEWPLISFAVVNHSRTTILKLHLKGALQKHGRPIPVAEQEFEVPIPGGLQPHESKRFELDAMLVGDWGEISEADVRQSGFTLTLEAVDDANGAKIVRR